MKARSPHFDSAERDDVAHEHCGHGRRCQSSGGSARSSAIRRRKTDGQVTGVDGVERPGMCREATRARRRFLPALIPERHAGEKKKNMIEQPKNTSPRRVPALQEETVHLWKVERPRSSRPCLGGRQRDRRRTGTTSTARRDCARSTAASATVEVPRRPPLDNAARRSIRSLRATVPLHGRRRRAVTTSRRRARRRDTTLSWRSPLPGAAAARSATRTLRAPRGTDSSKSSPAATRPALARWAFSTAGLARSPARGGPAPPRHLALRKGPPWPRGMSTSWRGRGMLDEGGRLAAWGRPNLSRSRRRWRRLSLEVVFVEVNFFTRP